MPLGWGEAATRSGEASKRAAATGPCSRGGRVRHLVALILILSPNAPLAIETHSLRRAEVLMIQDIDKKSN